MRHLRFLAIASVIAVAASAPHDVGAQGRRRIVITPSAGVLVPAARVVEVESAPAVHPTQWIRHQPAATFGLTASYWFNNLVGIEFGGAWAFGTVRASSELASVVPGLSLSGVQPAHVVLGSVKAMVNLLPITDRAALRLGVGPALVSRGGAAYDPRPGGTFSGLTEFGGAVSLCSRVPVTDVVSLRLRAENYLYATRLRFRGAATPGNEYAFRSRLQNDFLVSAGLQLVFWR